MSLLDRTLVIKSPIPPEDTKVLWIDMSSDSRSIKLWNANNGRWEPFGEGKNAVLYIKQVLKSKEKEQARKNIDAVSIDDFLSTKEKVDVFLSDIDTSEQSLNVLKELQESIKNDETLASQMLQDIIDNRTAITNEITRAKTAENTIKAEYVEKNGGDASNLVIDGEILKNLLENKVDKSDAILTTDNILYFDGFIDDVYNIQSGVMPWNGHIYYSRKTNNFVMRQIGGSTGGLNYQSYLFKVNEISSVGTYNILDNGIYTANKNNIYVDSDNNFYAFVNNEFVKIIEGNKKFTNHPILNKVIKELYISGTENYHDLYISWVVHKYSENDLVKCQFQIRDSNGIVCQYGDYVTEDHKVPTLVQLKENENSGVNGYAIIDWEQIPENTLWYGSSLDGRAHLTNMSIDISFSPSIQSYIGGNSVQYTEQNLTEIQQSQARKNIDAQQIISVNIKDNGNIILSNLQGESKEFMPATPSGDPMHMAYVAAGAVWDEDTQTWSANGSSGLSNDDVRALYNHSDMDELLFRRLWNKSCLVGTAQEYGRYNPITGFYELNGVWDLTFDESFNIYVRGNKGIVGASSWSTINNMRTTLEDGNINFIGLSWCFMEEYNNVHAISDSAYLIPFNGSSQGTRIYYCRKLRRITPIIYLYNYSLQTHIISCKSLKHISLYRPKKSAIINMWNDNEHISYYSLSYLINNANQAFTLNVDANTFAYLSGTADSTLLSQDAVDNGYGKIIPYDKNSKVIPNNTFWREELDIKGINGEYIYPSFKEYLAEHPENFATAEEWQALATLAEEKGITIATK